MRWKYWGREETDWILWYYPGLGSTFSRLVTSCLIRCCLTTHISTNHWKCAVHDPFLTPTLFGECDLYIWIFFAPSIFCTTRAKTVLILINFSDLEERRVSTERSCDLTCNQMQSAQPCAHYLLVINPGVIKTASSQTHPMEDFPPISPNREYSSGFNCMATAL